MFSGADEGEYTITAISTTNRLDDTIEVADDPFGAETYGPRRGPIIEALPHSHLREPSGGSARHAGFVTAFATREGNHEHISMVFRLPKCIEIVDSTTAAQARSAPRWEERGSRPTWPTPRSALPTSAGRRPTTFAPRGSQRPRGRVHRGRHDQGERELDLQGGNYTH